MTVWEPHTHREMSHAHPSENPGPQRTPVWRKRGCTGPQHHSRQRRDKWNRHGSRWRVSQLFRLPREHGNDHGPWRRVPNLSVHVAAWGPAVRHNLDTAFPAFKLCYTTGRPYARASAAILPARAAHATRPHGAGCAIDAEHGNVQYIRKRWRSRTFRTISLSRGCSKRPSSHPPTPHAPKCVLFPWAAAASEGPRHTFLGMLRFRAMREQS